MSEKLRVLLVFGTRPEAIKMAPVYMELKKHYEIEPFVCVTAQHREMLDQVLELFRISPEYDLNIMQHNQNLWTLTADVLLKMKDIYEVSKPHVVLVHGDTTTTMASSLSAFYSRVPVGHVEAGLRTFDKFYPFPEEINRVVTDNITTFYFAPTETSVENIKNSGIKDGLIYKTGNTVIDALLYTVKNHKVNLDYLNLNTDLKTILLTAHRRENFGEPLENICEAVLEIVENNRDVQVIYPVHLNPNVRKTVYEYLQDKERIILIEPMDYSPFCTLMDLSYLILTDSGGIQEEAPSLGKPVLVLREETERPEAVDYGTVKLVGANKNKIFDEVNRLLSDNAYYNSMSEAINPYGDGKASKRISQILLSNKDSLLHGTVETRKSIRE